LIADPSTSAALLAWFEGRERNVPWRTERNPYRVWVAEVMAQQTRLDTVLPYYGRFIERFPDIASLAGAELDQVLKSWEGLGYYARARHLHSAAREVVERYGGELPRDPGQLRELAGIGAYTAGAIASLAFGMPEPAVDGNARRVLSRLFDLADPNPAVLDEAARALLAPCPDSAARINQAIMDLGGAVCTPRRPDCPACPVRGECLALGRDTVSERPPTLPRRTLPHQEVAVGVVWRDGRVLIARRPEAALLGGLWEFPGGKIEPGESPAETVVRELREELEIDVRTGELIARIDHAYSHFRVTLHAHHAEWVAGEPRPRAATAWLWADPTELAEFAFPKASQRIIAAIGGTIDGAIEGG
jgi:A/G-specific adenine glycosylase